MNAGMLVMLLLGQVPSSYNGVTDLDLVKTYRDVQAKNRVVRKEIIRLKDLAGPPPGPFANRRNCVPSRHTVVQAKPRPHQAELDTLQYQFSKGEQSMADIVKELDRRGTSLNAFPSVVAP